MNTPFTLEQFQMVLEQYNLAIWPFQWVAYLLGIAVVVFSFKKTGYSNKIILGILSFLWLWNGIVFSFLFWAPTYPPAYVAGALFVVQGIFFAFVLFKQHMTFAARRDLYTIVGMIFIVYAMTGYPIFGW